jgi:hypothetical protein
LFWTGPTIITALPQVKPGNASPPESHDATPASDLFTFTRDKLFTGGVGLTNPIGRYVRIPWPDGLEAQAVTAGPVLQAARIDIARQDGQPFAIESFTAQLLANTAGAGGAFEIVPLLHGEDGVPDPFMYDATGISGNQFTYPTPELAGFDAYKIKIVRALPRNSKLRCVLSLPAKLVSRSPGRDMSLHSGRMF